MNFSLLSVRRAGTALARVWQWWTDELVGLYLDVVPKRLDFSRAHLRVTLETGTISAVMTRGASQIRLGKVPRPATRAALPDALAELLRRVDGDFGAITIELSSDCLLERSVELPIAMRRSLRAALSYQLDRLTPYQADGVYFQCRESATNQRPGKLRAVLAVTPKSFIDSLVAIVDPDGQRTVSVRVPSRPPTPPGIPLLTRVPRAQRALRLEWTLAGGAAMLAAALVSASLWRDNQMQTRLDAEIARLRPEADLAEAQRQQIEQRVAELDFLDHEMMTGRASDALVNVTKNLPPDTWLFQYQNEGNAIHLGGVTHDVTALVSALAAVPSFSNVSLRGSSHMPGGGGERFDLALSPQALGQTRPGDSP